MSLSHLYLDAILLALVAVAAVMDVKAGKVYNTLTYPGAALGLLLNAVNTPPAGEPNIGLVGAALGLLTGFVPLLFAYVAGGLGGGDVKLMGMVGAFLGPLYTLYALFYTFVAGAVLSVAMILWKESFDGLVTRLLLRPSRLSSTAEETAGAPGDPAEAGSNVSASGTRGGDRLRFPFAVAVLIGCAWVTLERSGSLLGVFGG